MNKGNYKPDTEFIVEKENTLFEYLKFKLVSKSKNNIKSLLANNHVLVDNKIITKYNYALKVNQKVAIKWSVNADNLDIIYEDKEIIVINKQQDYYR